MNFSGGLLLAAAISVAAVGPAQADLRSEHVLTGALAGKATRTAAAGAQNPARSDAARANGGASRVHKLVGKYARAAGVPVALALAVVEVESNFNPRARGRAGEIGLMQIKPATARAIGYRGSLKALYNPETNLAWGMKYLAEAQRRGDGTLCGTILKYNAGHYAKRMNKTSARYCGRVKAILRKRA